MENSDVYLEPNLTNGLKGITLIRTSKIATLDKSLVKGFLGKFNSIELSELNNKLKIILQLP